MGTTYRELFKLYDLIQCGDTRSVESFLKNCQVNINEVLPCKGIGVLHLATGIEPLEKSKECTELLLKYGADPNLCNDDGITPVHIAAIWGRVDNLKLLIGCGGDPSRHDLDGHSAFDYAAKEQQWAVYDYLHNVVDQLDDSFGSQCAYTLDLDKVLVATDQIVAEYEPIEKNHLCESTAPRKSDMVRDWCEKSSHVINKLYPTILGDSYLIENESVPWKSSDFTKNITFDLNTNSSDKSELNTTNNSYKTCLTKNLPYNVDISGVQRLESTAHLTDCFCNHDNSSDSKKNRMSIYENFSLPGSPNSITHKNYNSKSNLKKCKNCIASLCSDIKHMLTFDHTSSLVTNDASHVDLDKALVVVQNKTNEFLYSNISSVSDVHAMNTRRSSASSGVSSNYSGGSIVIGSMQEEYKYQDKEEDVVLIEKRLLSSSVVLTVEDNTVDLSPDQTILSIASSLPSSVEYDNNTLRAELIKLGFNPGPIQDSTRTLYLKKLHELKKNPIAVRSQGKMSTATQAQIEVLLNYMNNNKELAQGRLKGRSRVKLLWECLCNSLNSMGSCIKSVEQWQRVWADKKLMAKKAVVSARQLSYGTGGGPAVAPTLSETERILSIMGEGFGEQQTEARVRASPKGPPPRQEPTAISPTLASGPAQPSRSLRRPRTQEQPSTPTETQNSKLPTTIQQTSSTRSRRVHPYVRRRLAAPRTRINELEEQRLLVEIRRNEVLGEIKLAIGELCNLVREHLARNS